MPLPSIVRRRRQSTAIPSTVLIREIASAPPASAAWAIVGDAGDVGSQLRHNRAVDTPAGTAARPLRIAAGVTPKSTPCADVRARDVQLDGREAGGPSSRAAISFEFVDIATGNADDDRHSSDGR